MVTLGELARQLGLALEGDETRPISGLADLVDAEEDQLSFLSNPRYQQHLADTKAGAVILSPDHRQAFHGDVLLSDNPYVSYAHASALLDKRFVMASGIHPSATIDSTAIIASDASIGANCVIDANVTVDEGVRIGPGSIVGAGCRIGVGTVLRANVTLYDDIYVGSDCHIHSGVVIGSDGFGYARGQTGWVRIHQLGKVILGERVEIGANSCIDRGALGDTVIGDGVIIDNLVHIAHNVEIGENTAIAANVAIAGSTIVGSNCTIAGAVGIIGHLDIVDGVHITALSLVTRSITEAGSYSSGTQMGPTKEWRKNAVRFSRLDEIYRRLRALEESEQ